MIITTCKFFNQKYSTIEIKLDKLVEKFASSYNHKKNKFEIPPSYLMYKNFKNKVLEVAKNELKAKSDINFEYEEIKVNRAVKSLKITILKNGDKIKKDFADLKKKELQSSTKHKQIAQEQIKRLMNRNKDKIKDPLKYEQKLTQKYLQGTLNFDKDLQGINQELDKRIFDSI
jgi:plasmid replication initiation protein